MCWPNKRVGELKSRVEEHRDPTKAKGCRKKNVVALMAKKCLWCVCGENIGSRADPHIQHLPTGSPPFMDNQDITPSPHPPNLLPLRTSFHLHLENGVWASHHMKVSTQCILCLHYTRNDFSKPYCVFFKLLCLAISLTLARLSQSNFFNHAAIAKLVTEKGMN